MTKLFLSAFCLLLVTPAFACKPAPLEKCEKYNFLVNQHQYQNLVDVVKSYQGILFKTMKMPSAPSSCHKVGFASFYVEQLLETLKEHKGKTCLAQVTQVKESINRLVDKNSPEHKSISSTSDKKHLAREAKKVKIAMLALP